MQSCGELRIDPGTLETVGTAEIEIVVPFTEWALTEATLKRAAALSSTLNARLMLIAVHTIPYPMPFACPAWLHAQLVEQVIDLASRCPLPVHPLVVLARGVHEGFRHALKPESTVLIGAKKRPWRTAEEKLARMLVRDGHKVTLVHVE